MEFYISSISMRGGEDDEKERGKIFTYFFVKITTDVKTVQCANKQL